MEQGFWLADDVAQQVVAEQGSPVYVYNQSLIRDKLQQILKFPNAFGFVPRYAIKSAPTRELLRIVNDTGVEFDASSEYEVARCVAAGVLPEKISLSTQEFPTVFPEGVRFNACSLYQLRRFGELYPGQYVGIRINPGIGSGSHSKTTVGGPSSSFGIWHELLPDICSIASTFNLTINAIHMHIGSGNDSTLWVQSITRCLQIAKEIETIRSFNLGGGYKIDRNDSSKTVDLFELGQTAKAMILQFAEDTGRELTVEIEPGTFVMGMAGVLVAQVMDVVNTNTYKFIKLNCGMTEILRPTLYAAQHPIRILAQGDIDSYVVVGHCCESGDLLTPAENDSSELQPREFPTPTIGDLAIIEGCGAYCASMSAKGYNSFPEAPEVLLTTSGELKVIKRRRNLEDVLKFEP